MSTLNVTLRRHSFVVRRPFDSAHLPALERLAMAWLGVDRVAVSERRDAVVFARTVWTQRHALPSAEKSTGPVHFSVDFGSGRA